MTIPSDAVVFITGASSGIGAALAAGLAVPGRTVPCLIADVACPPLALPIAAPNPLPSLHFKNHLGPSDMHIHY